MTDFPLLANLITCATDHGFDAFLSDFNTACVNIPWVDRNTGEIGYTEFHATNWREMREILGY